MSRYGTRVVDRLAAAHILGPRSIAAHYVHVRRGEIGRLAQTRTNTVHNPRSNMNNAVGLAPVDELARAGVTVGLGNDGFSRNIMHELKAAYLLDKQELADAQALPRDM